jgi:choline dehydrogenase-like flavoprotein
VNGSRGEAGVRSGRRHGRDLRLDCDVVVVGSGAGGAVVAAYLAEAGKRVVVLEEGPHVPALGALRPSESVRHVFRDAGMTLAIGLGDSPAINVLTGRCIGGSSALTGGVCFRIPEHVLDEWSGDLGLKDLTPARMDRWFSLVEADVHVEEVPVAMRSRSTSLYIQGGESIGVSFASMRRNTRGCDGCGRCNFGCPHGAKMSVDVAYLPRAAHAGAEVWSDCLVERVRFDGDRALGVVGRLLDGPLGRPRSLFEVWAKKVVVAAGAMHTPLLLRASGLARPRVLGKNLTLHPSFRMMGRFDEPVRGWEGALQSAYSKTYEDDGMVLNSVFIPTGVIAGTLPGFGPRHAARTLDIASMAMFGGMLHDDGGGTVRRFLGREPLLTYRMSKRDRSRVPVLLRRMAEIFFAAGAREVFLPIFGAEPIGPDDLAAFPFESVKGHQIECTSQHPLGSCHMGVSPDDSVIGPDGQSWDVRGLYVADGSIFPTSLGVNPQLAVMAMAARIAHLMAA